ncbi:MAG: mucoidy inhibitor MuiA family protein [Flavobacteriales bacterium]
MKKYIACTLIIISISTAFANNKEHLNSKIKNVTVFLNGAQINREAYFNIGKGVYNLTIDSLPQYVNANSLQVSGKGDFIILDTKYLIEQPDYSNQQNKYPVSVLNQLAAINDSIEQVNFDLEEIRFNKEVLETEKQFLIGNKSMKSDSLALLKDALAFLREKYNDINAKLILAKKAESKTQKRLNKLQERLNTYNQELVKQYSQKPMLPNHKVIITVKTDLAISGKLILNYMVSGASWTPSYDLRANQINEPIALTYKANIIQNTGENWDDVKLKLSTNNPYKSKVKPVLPVWYLNYYNPYNNQNTRSTSVYGGVARPQMAKEKSDKYLDEDVILSDAESSAYYTTMTESFTNVEFNLNTPYSIPSDGDKHIVAVKEEKLPAEFKYYMVPKMDNNAFLVANIRGFEELNLLPASANIYFDGTYIGQTAINTTITGDSLAIDLGREERISAKRTALKIIDKDKVLGGNKVKDYGFEIVVKNNLLAAIDLIIEDQLPISTDKDIKVELKNKDKAEFKEQTGYLIWKLKLPQKETKKLSFNYEVQHPKDKQLALN